MMQKNYFRLDGLQITAVVLVVLLSGLMVAINGADSQAMRISDIQPILTVRADLNTEQPVQILQTENQWLARFTISTESVGPIKMTGLVFVPRGTLAAQVLRAPDKYKLALTRLGEPIGKGATWIFDNNLTQTVTLDVPFNLDLSHPLEIDVSTDLNGQQEETFGVTLIGITTVPVTSSQGLPIEGKLFEIQERL